VRGRTLAPLGETRVAGVTGLRDVAVAPDGAVWALDQEEFLATVTGVPQAESAAHAVSAERMRTATS